MAAPPVQDVIIDTDPGVDDAMAILLALSCEHVNVIGVTIVHGNLGNVPQLARNARRVLALARRKDVPVFMGSSQPLHFPPHKGAPFVHGSDGMGDVESRDDDDGGGDVVGSETESAVDFLVRQALLPRNVPLAVVALGPLTNLAAACARDGRVASRVRPFCMGGNFLVPGNVSTNAEANVWNDPHAANEVFSRFERVTLAPLDVTTTINFGADYTAALAARAPVLGRFIQDICRFYLKFHEEAMRRDCCDMHDSSAVLSLIAPHLFTRRELHWVRVETSAGLCRGVCVADMRGSTENAVALPKSVEVMLEADAPAVLAYFADAIERLERKL